MLASTRGRKKFAQLLDHDLEKYLNSDLLIETPDDSIIESLKECYVMSSIAEHDKRCVDGETALTLLRTEFFGLVVVFNSGTLAAVKPESSNTPVWMSAVG